MESLSSPGEHSPAFVSVTLLSHAYENISIINIYNSPLCVSVLWERIFKAHTNRRIPKTASTLTMSSDDMDERDMASESGLLFPFCTSSQAMGNKLHHSILSLHLQNTLIVSRSKCERFHELRLHTDSGR